ncbi:Gfo/Idh/MocA family oxidoreductase [Parasedimentitalea maritima]|uniref:Gfo/Idh/MocA family oxidoreductase n=1 Tax=Parasedimentitalea maritima TaxID=2578117 RepID=A0ABY2UUC6_9RHOB|nr:Gfo/Idh/MocA family oxidoreductase [Zongyanglinia marina]TLP62715.1 Gfo/Idh/MocA family oxidoreductase [Zongyanglinia marina]
MNWGLIGASTIASEHMIGAIRANSGHDVVSVQSSSPTRGKEYAAKHGITASTTSLSDILNGSDVDAVYISTTNEKHLPQAMTAIAAGKHVLCEKPLAMTVADAATMVRAAQDAGIVLATNHHLRNAGSHLAIRNLITTGRLGEVLSIRIFHAVMLPEHLRGWRIDNPLAGGGVIPDIVVHDADTVRFYLGEDPADIVAQELSGAMGVDVEDSVMSVWTTPSGVTVQTHESFTHPFAGSGIEVHGTKGSVIARNVMTQQPVGDILLRTASGEESIEYSLHNLYERSVSKFATAVAGDRQPAATGVDGLKSLAVAEAVKKAAVTGQRTTVDYGGY